jgi:hypothetical protein
MAGNKEASRYMTLERQALSDLGLDRAEPRAISLEDIASEYEAARRAESGPSRADSPPGARENRSAGVSKAFSGPDAGSGLNPGREGRRHAPARESDDG